MKRSTKIAPDSLSTSYFTGSAFIGISMITLKASGTCLPGETLSRDMICFRQRRISRRGINPHFTYAKLLGSSARPGGDQSLDCLEQGAPSLARSKHSGKIFFIKLVECVLVEVQDAESAFRIEVHVLEGLPSIEGSKA